MKISAKCKSKPLSYIAIFELPLFMLDSYSSQYGRGLNSPFALFVKSFFLLTDNQKFWYVLLTRTREKFSRANKPEISYMFSTLGNKGKVELTLSW